MYPPVDFSIDAAHVEAFARTLGLDPASGVPPTYAAVYALATTARQLFEDAEAAIDFANLLHREQDFEWRRQAEVGEVVTAQGRVTSDTERRGIRFITLESTVNAAGEPLCLSRSVFVVGGGPA